MHTDRTRQIFYEVCPRLRFWHSIYGGWGIQPSAPNLDMELGKDLHAGISCLLANTSATSQGKYGLISTSYGNLIQGLLEDFRLVWLPKILTKYNVLKIEQEADAWISEDILMMARPDAILEDKSSGELGIWSIKTTSRWNKIKELENKVDIQGLSETWTAEQALGKEIKWVQMFYILTGPKEDTPDGPIHNSPAYQGWVKEEGFGSKLAHSFQWKDTGGKIQRLGKGWRKFDVALEYKGGIPQWIFDLHSNKIQPEAGKVLEELFVCPPAYYRNPQDIEEWRQSTFFQEDKIKISSSSYNDPNVSSETKDRILLKVFPKHRSSCIRFNRQCEMYPLCHGTAGEQEDPFNNGFKWREVNHPQETQ